MRPFCFALLPALTFFCVASHADEADSTVPVKAFNRGESFSRVAFFRLATRGEASSSNDRNEKEFSLFPGRRLISEAKRQALTAAAEDSHDQRILSSKFIPRSDGTVVTLVAFNELHMPLFAVRIRTDRPHECIVMEVRRVGEARIAVEEAEAGESGASLGLVTIRNAELTASLLALALDLKSESVEVLQFDKDVDFENEVFPGRGLQNVWDWPVKPSLAVLSMFKEPSLTLPANAPETPTVRLLLIPTFTKPVCVRAFLTPDGPKIRVVVLSGKGGYDWGKILVDRTRAVEQADWDRLLEAAERPGAITPLETMTDENREIFEQWTGGILDGTSRSLELSREGDYLSETLESPDIVEAQLTKMEDESGSREPFGTPIPTLRPFVDLGNMLLDMAGLEEAVFE